MTASSLGYDAGLDVEAFVDRATSEPWGDGLPFAPFEPAAIEAALSLLGLDPEELVGDLPLTASELCAIGMLAGGTPDLMPAVFGAVVGVAERCRAVGSDVALDPEAARAVFVNGPVISRLGVNVGLGLMGPGFPANASLGRAVQLSLRYCGMALAQQWGDPAQYALGFGEDEGDDWVPFHLSRGFDRDANTVTVFTYRKAGRVFDRTSRDSDGCLERIGLFLRDHAGATDWFGEQPLSALVAVGQEWRRQFVADGYSKQRLADEIHRRATDDATYGRTPRFEGADAFSIIGCGGPADASIWFFVGIAGAPVTRSFTQV